MEEIKKICPQCGATEKQIWHGHNRSGSRKSLCRECGRRYTLEPLKHGYTEEEQRQAFKLLVSGMSGRQIGLGVESIVKSLINFLLWGIFGIIDLLNANNFCMTEYKQFLRISVKELKQKQAETDAAKKQAETDADAAKAPTESADAGKSGESGEKSGDADKSADSPTVTGGAATTAEAVAESAAEPTAEPATAETATDKADTEPAENAPLNESAGVTESVTAEIPPLEPIPVIENEAAE